MHGRNKQGEPGGSELEQRAVSEQGWAVGTVDERGNPLCEHKGISKGSEEIRYCCFVFLSIIISWLRSCCKTNNNVAHPSRSAIQLS